MVSGSRCSIYFIDYSKFFWSVGHRPHDFMLINSFDFKVCFFFVYFFQGFHFDRKFISIKFPSESKMSFRNWMHQTIWTMYLKGCFLKEGMTNVKQRVTNDELNSIGKKVQVSLRLFDIFERNGVFIFLCGS